MRLGNRELRVALIVATGFIGCADGSAPRPYEKVGEVSQEWGTAQCSTAVADWTQSFKIDPHLSPQSYNTCTKSYVVDLVNYGAAAPPGAGGGPPDAGGGTGGTGGSATEWGEPNLTVRWGDSLPTTETECEASQVGGIFYSRVPADGGWTWVSSNGQNKQYGVWSDGQCHFAPVVYEPLVVGEWYRVAATARTSSNQTRIVSIRTGDPDVP